MKVITRQVPLEHGLIFWESLCFSYPCSTCSSIFNSVTHCLTYSCKFKCATLKKKINSIQWLTYLYLLISVKNFSDFHQSMLWKNWFFKAFCFPWPNVIPREEKLIWLKKKNHKYFNFVWIHSEKYSKECCFVSTSLFSLLEVEHTLPPKHQSQVVLPIVKQSKYNWVEIQMKRQNFRVSGLPGEKKKKDNFLIAHPNTISYVSISNTRNLGTTAQDQTQDHILSHSVNLPAWSLVSYKIAKNSSWTKLVPFPACHMTRKILLTPGVYKLTIKTRGKRQTKTIQRNLKTILTVMKVTSSTSSMYSFFIGTTEMNLALSILHLDICC